MSDLQELPPSDRRLRQISAAQKDLQDLQREDVELSPTPAELSDWYSFQAREALDELMRARIEVAGYRLFVREIRNVIDEIKGPDGLFSMAKLTECVADWAVKKGIIMTPLDWADEQLKYFFGYYLRRHTRVERDRYDPDRLLFIDNEDGTVSTVTMRDATGAQLANWRDREQRFREEDQQADHEATVAACEAEEAVAKKRQALLNEVTAKPNR